MSVGVNVFQSAETTVYPPPCVNLETGVFVTLISTTVITNLCNKAHPWCHYPARWCSVAKSFLSYEEHPPLNIECTQLCYVMPSKDEIYPSV